MTDRFEKLVKEHIPGSESYNIKDFRTPDGLCHSCRGKLRILEEGKIHRFPNGVPPAFDWEIDFFRDPGDNFCACIICVRAPARHNLKVALKAKKVAPTDPSELPPEAETQSLTELLQGFTDR